MLGLLLDAIYWWLVLILALILAGLWKEVLTPRGHQKREES